MCINGKQHLSNLNLKGTTASIDFQDGAIIDPNYLYNSANKSWGNHEK